AEGYPLGIGAIKLHSALNQNLNAEIPLVLGANENIADVRVSLASPEKFDEAGVPWGYFLTNLKFETELAPDGSALIRVSSKEAVKEPFLNFLLEVSWPQGDIYREFTLLVDPPATYMQPIVPVAAAPEVRREKAKPRVTAGYAPGDVYTVHRNETLWQISEKLNPAGVSVEQAMIALYEANPEAFYQSNVNTLKAGARLRVPEKEAMLRLTQQQARALFARQNQEWRDRFSAPEEKPAEQVAEETGSQLKLIAPTEEVVEQSASVTGGEIEATERPSGIAEAVETETPEYQEIKAQMDKLQQQLTEMQKMLAMKDAQLARLQGGEALPGVELQADSGRPPSTEQAPAEMKPGEKVKTSVPTAPTTEKAKPKPKPATPPRVQEESHYYAWVGGIGAVVLGFLGWFWWRRKKIEEEEAHESMFSSSFASSSTGFGAAAAGQEGGAATGDNLGYEIGTVGESSILSEFTPSDFDAFETDQSEVDPISEADVYLAYGRYQQAEDLMLQAIDEHPDRDECKLKLLEIYYANENKKKFEDYARTLADQGKKEDAGFWPKVVEMSRELCPESSLFAAGTNTKSSFSTADETLEAEAAENVTDKGKETASEEVEALEESDEDEIGDDNLIEFEAGKDKPLSTEEPSESEEDLKTDEFNIDFTSDSDESDTRESLDFSPGEEEDLGLQNFDFTGDQEVEELEEDLGIQGNEEDFSFDLDLDAPVGEMDKSSGVADLTDMDEFETKIDLAKAYVDMGDEEAARDIAQEVLEKGSEEQKKEAQAILDKL
ncbi:MAG: FimV/HubP family polar landmark protein, partial [Gammaproteobacteria bacterium]